MAGRALPLHALCIKRHDLKILQLLLQFVKMSYAEKVIVEESEARDQQPARSGSALSLIESQQNSPELDDNITDSEVALIQAVRMRPILWHQGHEDYKNIRRKNVIWRDVAKDLQLGEGKFLFIIIVVFRLFIIN
jgi:hypothetical protein